jgi:hypothetical protein
MFEPEFTFNQAPEIASAAITMALFVVLISIGLDLGAFKPGYLRWLYFGSLAGLLGLAMNFGFSVGLLATDDGLQIYPLALLADGWSATLIAIVILAIALAADHLIYINSDHYLR